MRLFTLAVLANCAASASGQVAELKTVHNIPFTASIETQTVQALADGNTITRNSSALIARDSAGRTRREQGPAVFLTDPGAGVARVLNTVSHTVQTAPIRSTEATAAPRNEVKSEDLGTGVRGDVGVTGTRLTRTVAAGTVGNERPFEVIMEVWYSPELQTTIASTTTDPRTGRVTWELKGIQRGEPGRSLFAVPDGYAEVGRSSN